MCFYIEAFTLNDAIMCGLIAFPLLGIHVKFLEKGASLNAEGQ